MPRAPSTRQGCDRPRNRASAFGTAALAGQQLTSSELRAEFSLSVATLLRGLRSTAATACIRVLHQPLRKSAERPDTSQPSPCPYRRLATLGQGKSVRSCFLPLGRIPVKFVRPELAF